MGKFLNAHFYTIVRDTLISLIFKWQSDRVNEQYRIREEVQQLENAAMRAQMNPHFIFNCLNSIQKFVGEGNELEAMHYLAKFAQLIRQVLNASRNEEVSLHDEISLLKNYVALEQLRMKDRFEFEVNIPTDLDVFTTTVPPLILQPFVENAIVHGFAEPQEKGVIQLTFKQEGDFLLVVVQDNGAGLWKKAKTASLKQDSMHKSVGLTLVERRLQILNGQATNFTLQELTQVDHNTKGTLVKIRIRQKA
ncbi:MAG: sensor histidine kinase [Saprospiraceae bacterium]